MRLLHTSDWHLGRSENDHNMQEDQRFFIDAICNIIEQEDIDAVLLAGDVYDRSVASADAIRLYDEAMTRICMDLGVSVFCIAGNHDGAERLSSCSALLERAGLHVTMKLGDGVYVSQRKPRPEHHVTELSTNDSAEMPVRVFMLPWITEEKVRSLYPDQKDSVNSMTDAYQIVCDTMREQFREGDRNILIAHAFIVNAQTSTSDRAAEIGFATAVNSSVFDGFDYVALGHIHKPQDITDRIRYSGTPMPYSFGKEEKQEKSVTIIDTETMEKKIVPLPLLHQRATITGTFEEVMNYDCVEEVRNGYLRLQINDAYVGIETIAQLYSRYPNALEISGKQFEDSLSSIHLSMEEFREIENDPVEIFRHFYMDTVTEEGIEEPDEHLMELFKQAMIRYEEDSNL